MEYLEFSKCPIWIEHGIALLDELALLLAGRQDHGLHIAP